MICVRARKASLVCSIALPSAGKAPLPEAALVSAFPKYADLADKDGRDRLSIEQVLMVTDQDETTARNSGIRRL
jgi:hypothetical protein